MFTLSINSNINIIKEHLEFLKRKFEEKEEISPEIVQEATECSGRYVIVGNAPEIVQEAIEYYTKLVKQINELIELIEKYEKAINEIDDYVDLIRYEVDKAR